MKDDFLDFSQLTVYTYRRINREEYREFQAKVFIFLTEQFRNTHIFQLLPFMLWRFSVLLLGTNIPISKLMSFAFQRNNVSEEVVAAYSAPFPSRLFKAGAAKWPLMVPLLKVSNENYLTIENILIMLLFSPPPSSISLKDDPVTAHMEAARNCLKTWKKPVLVMFGDR